MEMFFLVLLINGHIAIIPEKYNTLEDCDIAGIAFGIHKCIPAPAGNYCKWVYRTEIVTAGNTAIPVTTKQCEE